MANRIRCAFCDYVMDLPASLAKKADAKGRIEWMCEGCGSPIVLDAASTDALTANPPAPVASGPQPTAAALPPKLPPPLPSGPTRSTVPRPSQASAPVRRVAPPPPPPPPAGGARMTLPPPPPLPVRAQPPQPPAIPPIVQALAASPATTQESHAGARVSGVHPTAHAESRTLPHAAPSPTPTPTVAPLLFEANDAMGVLPPHPELGAPPKPSAEGTSRPSRESAGEVTQRSLQVPRWVAGSMMVAALGVIALGGVLVHQGLITFKSSGAAKAPAPTQASPATQNAMRPASEQAAPGRVVAAAFSDAAPNAAPSATSPTPAAAAAPRPGTGFVWPLPQKDDAKNADAKGSESAPTQKEPSAESSTSAAHSSSSATDEKSAASAPDEKPAEAKQGEEAKASDGDHGATSEDAAPPGPPAPPFDQAAAAAALGAAQARAQTCRKSNESGGIVRVAVTFAPSGRATNAVLSGAFAGTDTGSCIASNFRGASVPAFTGPMVTVSKTVAID